MANKNVFASFRGQQLPVANVRNEAGGQAYQLTPKQALAQYVMTGCLNTTFYAQAEQQLDWVLQYSNQVDAKFIAQLAVYARQQGYMKDMPALLVAVLANKDLKLFSQVFPQVIDNGKMLRNFVQMIRSGQSGRKSLGSRPKKMVQNWLAQRSVDQLFHAAVGQSPSLADIIKMVHPHPTEANRAALYGYLIGRPVNTADLPEIVRQFEQFKQGEINEVPEVPFQMLTALSLSAAEWQAIARQAPWQMTRMNLNTFARHGVYTNAALTRQLANRLRSAELIKKARVFPYQLMTSYIMLDKTVPSVIKDALQQALEIALTHVPRLKAKVYVCPDVSGSMQMPVTGYRKGATSVVRCVDVAALLAVAIVRTNRQANILPFDTQVYEFKPRQGVLHNAQQLAQFGGGGTNCSLPLQLLNQQRAKADLVIYISDNESWADRYHGRGTGMMAQWQQFQKRNPKARLVCLDIQPYGTVQTQPRPDVLHIGGFSDAVFKILPCFVNGQLHPDYWVNQIEALKVH